MGHICPKGCQRVNRLKQMLVNMKLIKRSPDENSVNNNMLNRKTHGTRLIPSNLYKNLTVTS